MDKEEEQTLSRIIEELTDDRIISMDSRQSLVATQHEVRQKYQYLIHELTEKYPHICQRPRCKKKIMFGWLYDRVQKQGISPKEFITIWINPEYQKTKDKPFKFLCYFCYENRLKRERAKKDAFFKNLCIESSVKELFHNLIEFKKKAFLLRNDTTHEGAIWYENLIIFTLLKIHKIKNKITHPIVKKTIDIWIERGIRDLTEITFTDMRLTTLYFKMKWSIWKIKRYYMKRYRKLSDDHKKRSSKLTLKRIRKEIRKDKRFERN